MGANEVRSSDRLRVPGKADATGYVGCWVSAKAGVVDRSSQCTKSPVTASPQCIVPGYSVVVIELEPGEASATPAGLIEGSGTAIPDPRDWTASPDFREDPSMSLTASLSVDLPDEAMARCNLLLIARSNGELPEFPALTVNGKEFEAPVVSGSGDTPGSMQFLTETDAVHWSLRTIDLLNFTGEIVEIVATSSRNGVPFLLDAWLVADRPVETEFIAEENLPPTTWHNYRRQTVRLLEYRLGMTPMHM